MALLDKLCAYEFAGKNEATIRDNWIIPLLGLLGYGQASNLNEILSEEPLKLQKPTRKVGSKTMFVDYVPTVMKRRFWILEAKAPDQAEDWEEHLGQAWGYATHPEIDVPLMAIADGSKIDVFDLTLPIWDKPIVHIPQAELAERFDELANRLGARQVVLFVEGRQFRHLRTVMHSQVDPSALDRLVSDVEAMAKEARHDVLANRAAVLKQAAAEQEATTKMIDESTGTWAISQEVNFPFASSWLAAKRAVEVVLSREDVQRLTEFRQFDLAVPMKEGHRRVFWWWRAVRLAYAFQLRDNRECGAEADAIAREGLRAHLNLFADDDVARAAHRLQLAMVPLALRLAASSADLPATVEKWNKPLTDQVRLKHGYTESGLAIGMIDLFMRAFWAQHTPWSASALNELAEGAENLLAGTNTAGLAMLGPAHDSFLERWGVADPLVEATLTALERYGGALRADSEVIELVAQYRDDADPRIAELAASV